nr:hypothetical protein Q903MT_gene4843 [Picea sitchensis]
MLQGRGALNHQFCYYNCELNTPNDQPSNPAHPACHPSILAIRTMPASQPARKQVTREC